MKNVLALLLAVCTLGCSAAAKAVRTNYADFNQTIQYNNSQQMLLNLVRLKYRETPLFLKVGALSASYSLGVNASLSAGRASSHSLLGAEMGGSFSVQPVPGSAGYVHLFSWVTGSTTEWQAFFSGYRANGGPIGQPGVSPGPEWTNLQLNRWYRFTADIRFGQNRVANVTVTDLETGQCAEAELTGVYLEGGSGGGAPRPTGFRLFAGAGVPGNLVAWDNPEMREGVAEECPLICVPCDMNCDTAIDALDIEFFIELLFNNAVPCCGERGVPGSAGDVNGDGNIDALDIEGFINCLFP